MCSGILPWHYFRGCYLVGQLAQFYFTLCEKLKLANSFLSSSKMRRSIIFTFKTRVSVPQKRNCSSYHISGAAWSLLLVTIPGLTQSRSKTILNRRQHICYVPVICKNDHNNTRWLLQSKMFTGEVITIKLQLTFCILPIYPMQSLTPNNFFDHFSHSWLQFAPASLRINDVTRTVRWIKQIVAEKFRKLQRGK